MTLTLKIPDEFYTELHESLKLLYRDAMEQARHESVLGKNFLTPSEVVSSYLNITRPTLNNWIAKGLPIYEIEGKKFIKRDELDTFIIKHKK